MHVPETGHDVLAATVDDGCVLADRDVTTPIHRRYRSPSDLDGHVALYTPRGHVDNGHVRYEKWSVLASCAVRGSCAQRQNDQECSPHGGQWLRQLRSRCARRPLRDFTFQAPDFGLRACEV